MNRDERGTATVWFVCLLPAFIVLAGLVFDGAAALSAKRRAMNVAEAAARAGALVPDRLELRDGGPPVFDAAQARTRAQTYLARAEVLGSTSVAGELVTVEVELRQPMAILGLVGIPQATVEGTGSARAARGLAEAGL